MCTERQPNLVKKEVQYGVELKGQVVPTFLEERRRAKLD